MNCHKAEKLNFANLHNTHLSEDPLVYKLYKSYQIYSLLDYIFPEWNMSKCLREIPSLLVARSENFQTLLILLHH